MNKTNALQVTLCADGFYPQTLRWQGRTVRVLNVEGMQTCGLERRYRLRTTEGRYELGLHIGAGIWQVRRSPSWLDRTWARVQRVPRYPLPAWQRRARAQRSVPQPAAAPQPRGGSHAVRLALVRQ